MQSTAQSVLVHLSINESISQLNLITPFQGKHEHNESFEGEVHSMVVRMLVPATYEWENLGITRSMLCVVTYSKRTNHCRSWNWIAWQGQTWRELNFLHFSWHTISIMTNQSRDNAWWHVSSLEYKCMRKCKILCAYKTTGSAPDHIAG